MGADKKYDLFPADLGCRPEASQLELEPSDVCCTAACTHIIISGSTTAQTDRMTHYTLTHQVYSGRPVYTSDSRSDFLYYHGDFNMWMVGPYVGSATTGMYVSDRAMSPDQIRGIWRLAVGSVATFFPSVKASCAECRQITISGSSHSQEAAMTTYSLTDAISDDRPVYSSDTSPDFLYFYEPFDEWMVGPTVGSGFRGLTTDDIHLYPEQIEAVWKLWDGSAWVPFPRVLAECTDIDDCASTPCLNGGVCTDQHNSYSCSCAAGWQGDNCEISISLQVNCASTPCQHGGVCTDVADSYTCTCTAGWEGNECEVDKNECDTVICNSGYECVNHPGYYVCLPYGFNGTASTSDECGIPSIPPAATGKIHGGVESTAFSWPWQVSLRLVNAGGIHVCGGSLISDQWVLTAAHCLDEGNEHTTHWKVKLGLHDVDGTAEQQRQVIKLIMHEQFSAVPHTYNDVALLKLDHPVTITQKVSPICLPTGPTPINTDCYITGWGATALDSQGDNIMATTLQQTRVSIKDDSYCSAHWIISYYPESMLCAEQAGVSGCEGDSGGPMACPSADLSTWELTGIISWGENPCGAHVKPGIFTRVHSFVGWINDKMATN
ncbi:coagulation factor VII-like [Branchiostoma floridae]|uniref:Coagulation factor VII-like n=1 Tax=Branchiostoma floridae TaxID=7739 RepID=A0A9J7HIN4_BRAFL|nr:coagulation factor VII-like [Branchiostoma floridae]